MTQIKSKIQRTFDVSEFAEKARQSLQKLKKSQQPGQQTTGSKSDVVLAVKSDIKKLMDEGYTAKQIAEAFSNDVFGILPKSITELVEGKRRVTSKRQGGKTQADSKTSTSIQPTTQAAQAEKRIGDAGSIVVKQDSEDL